MRIDSHQHFWRVSRGDYGWLTPELGPIHRDFLPQDLTPLLKAHGIDRTVVVQAAPSEAGSAFLLDLASRTPFVAGVVGWVDFEAPDARESITRLAQRPALVGLRPMIQDLAEDEWMMRETLVPAIETMIETGLCFDALVKPRHLRTLKAFAQRFPRLPVVIDHGAKPDIAGGALESWARGIEPLSREPNVACKLSGLATEASSKWTPADLAPVLRRDDRRLRSAAVDVGQRLAGAQPEWRLPGLVLRGADADGQSERCGPGLASRRRSRKVL
jgi:L-fuconolactonase